MWVHGWTPCPVKPTDLSSKYKQRATYKQLKEFLCRSFTLIAPSSSSSCFFALHVWILLVFHVTSSLASLSLFFFFSLFLALLGLLHNGVQLYLLQLRILIFPERCDSRVEQRWVGRGDHKKGNAAAPSPGQFTGKKKSGKSGDVVLKAQVLYTLAVVHCLFVPHLSDSSLCVCVSLGSFKLIRGHVFVVDKACCSGTHTHGWGADARSRTHSIVKAAEATGTID